LFVAPVIAVPFKRHWYEYVMPAGAFEAKSVTDPPWQKVVAPTVAIAAVGKLFTVTVTLAVFEHPLALVIV
jgi:hypothetical protein